MKIKLSLTLISVFLAFTSTVYSQIDLIQLEALEKRQEELEDIDDYFEDKDSELHDF